MASPLVTAPRSSYIAESDCRLDDFQEQVARETDLADYPHASAVRRNVLVYSADSVRSANPREVQAELICALADGPGVLVVESAFGHDAVDAASAELWALICAEDPRGDHFGTPGANNRVWNAAQKLALHAPRVYAEYYANDVLATVSQAWLGPRYELTSQVNVVNPGGKAQVPHRDYHLGFVSPAELWTYPAHVHAMSPQLTLQGAIAHCDMPIESGPTMLLPYSQHFLGGYIAFNRPEFINFFADNHVQVPMRKGDAVFFNPALFHGAGANTSADVRRMANLLQISSPFGRAMEAIDHSAMVRAVYPALVAMRAAGRPEQDLHNVVLATADPSPFPTNLDLDQPIDSRCPASQADVVLAALSDALTYDELDAALRDHDDRRIP